MTKQSLLKILETLPDNANIYVRDRDCIGKPDINHVVGSNHEAGRDEVLGCRFTNNMEDVYGGEENDWIKKPALVLCAFD